MHRVLAACVVVLSLVGAAEAHVRVRVRPPLAPRVLVGWGGWGWYGPPVVARRMAPPDLAEVDLNVRPKHARVRLDDRLIGPADEFDGFPGFLYLQPGSYRLELDLGGYRAESFDLEVSAGGRYDVKVRLERVPGTDKERWWEVGDGEPVQRVFAPVRPARPGGADVALRPDLAPPAGTDTPAPPSARSGGQVPPARGGVPTAPTGPDAGPVRLHVTPEEAAVYLDGAFLATAGQLNRLQGGLAVAAGRHVLEVVAPGYRSVVREIEVSAAASPELTIHLEPER